MYLNTTLKKNDDGCNAFRHLSIDYKFYIDLDYFRFIVLTGNSPNIIKDAYMQIVFNQNIFADDSLCKHHEILMNFLKGQKFICSCLL